MNASLWTMYEDIYAALYSWSLRRWHGNDYMASFLTASSLSGAQGMNFIALAILSSFLVGRDAFRAIFPSYTGLVVICAILLTNYLVFVRRRRYDILFKRFQRYPMERRRSIAKVAWIYAVTSMIAPILLAFFLEGRGPR